MRKNTWRGLGQLPIDSPLYVASRNLLVVGMNSSMFNSDECSRLVKRLGLHLISLV